MRFLTSILLISSLSANSQTAEVKTNSKIDKVTVFLNGAQINRTAGVELIKGDNEIRFVNLSQYINPNSVQVKGQASFKIVSVNHQTNYLDDKKQTPEIKELSRKLKDIKEQIKQKRADEFVLAAEKEMILSNSDIAGEENGVDIIELLDIADYYRNRLNLIDDNILSSQRDRKELSKDAHEMQKQLDELGYKANQPSGEIIVKISSERASNVRVEFSYIVSEAGWEPLYEVRSEDITGPVELTYRGNVYQNTGQDWDKVQLTLSTGNPSISGTKPEFNAWTLSNIQYYDKRGKQEAITGGADSQMFGEVEKESSKSASESSADYTTVAESGVNTEFKINLPYTIQSDGKKLSVEIQKYSLPVQYQYSSIPRLDQDAFLIARVSGWDEYYLLSGSANIYYQGTFVGSSYINTQTTQDTLIISLGRDNNIVVNRERVRDYGGTSFIGSNRKTEIGMRVSVKNTKRTTITIEIEDHIPLSVTKEIEVSLINKGDAYYDEATGKLKWKLVLGPGESRVMNYTYTVKSPKTMILTNI